MGAVTEASYSMDATETVLLNEAALLKKKISNRVFEISRPLFLSFEQRQAPLF